MIENSFVADGASCDDGDSPRLVCLGNRGLVSRTDAWEHYRTAVLLTLGLFAAESLLIGLLLLERRRRKLSQELNRAVLTSLSAQIAILDRDGTIIRVNEAWRDGARFGEVEPHGDAFVGWNYLEECRRAEARGSEEAVRFDAGSKLCSSGANGPSVMNTVGRPPTSARTRSSSIDCKFPKAARS